MMEIKEAVEKLEKSKEFKSWKKENNLYYLSHAFIMIDPQVKEEWQIGYCNPKNNNITSFSVSEKITQNPESEALNDDTKILKLDMEKVNTTLQHAMETAEKTQKEKYSAHSPFKKIVLLQNLDLGQVWNVTYVTNTFKTLNIKIDSETGKVLKDELMDLFRIEK
jgi:hypothetical protein